MEEGAVDNPRIEELMTHLADRLRFTSGKKQYGYLKAPLKAVVDEIVDELARDPRVAQAYDLWYEMREEVLRTYKNDLPERLPLSRQKEFKPIKNMVIQEAVRLGELRQIFHPEDQAEDVLPEQEGADGPQPEPEADGKEKPPDSGAPRTLWKQIYRRARVILKDPNAAPEQTAQVVELQMKAAEHGNCSAAFTLGQLYLSGTTLLRDPAAVRWLERAALGGNQYAQYRLGKLLLQGEDVPKDADGAVRWLTASAEQGSQYAQYALGKLYLLGEEVPEDREAARQWFQQAAEQGNMVAQNNLGVCYHDGKGVPQDYSEAVKWWRKAAEQGFATARYHIGFSYYRGHGVPQDRAKAIDWFLKAAKQGNIKAKNKLKELGYSI